MDLHVTADQQEIIDSTRAFLSEEMPADRWPKLSGQAIDVADWRRMAAMGWFGLGIEEAAGGFGQTLVEEALVVQEFGRHLVPPSALATVLAAHIAASLGRTELTGAYIDGRRRAAFAIGGGAQGGLTIMDCADAEDVVVWTTDEIGLADMSALRDFQRGACIDMALQGGVSTGLAAADLHSAYDAPKLRRHAQVLAAAMLTGGAEATRDISAEYAKIRHQFGQPIGAFQAISHRCAQMAVASEQAAATTQFAAVAVRDGRDKPELYAATAKWIAGRAAYESAVDAMQIFGGYGQTYDFLPHFYLKRAIMLRALGGDAEAEATAILAADATL